jgi:hypothetical protein
MIAGLAGGNLLGGEEPGGSSPSFLGAIGGFFDADQRGECARFGLGASGLIGELKQ